MRFAPLDMLALKSAFAATALAAGALGYVGWANMEARERFGDDYTREDVWDVIVAPFGDHKPAAGENGPL